MELLDNALNNNDFDDTLFKAKIAVCGLGGGGSNTIQRMVKQGIKSASFIAVNTDSKHLNSLDPSINRILIGGPLTKGLGAGGFPEMGARAAEYSRGDLKKALDGYNLVFVCAGMGGGTGGGAAPIAAGIAKENGAIVIGIVTFPFRLEKVRLQVAMKSIQELRKNVDTLIVIDNQRLVSLYQNLALEQAFRVADEVAYRAVRGITETVNTPSFINLDFADVKAVMNSGGLAMISIGEGKGTNKVDEAVEDTLKNKLLDVDYDGATGVLMHITGGDDLTLGEANEIGRKLTEHISQNANILWGARVDPAYNGKIELIAIFTGVKSPSILGSSESGEFGPSNDRKSYGIDEI
jgi:cell division protein FtsZ